MSGAKIDSTQHTRMSREFNLVLASTIAVALAFLFISAVFGEAVIELATDEESNVGVRVPVWELSLIHISEPTRPY